MRRIEPARDLGGPWIDGEPLIDAWKGQPATGFSATIALQAGSPRDIRRENLEGGGPQTLRLSWSSTSTKKQIVPASALRSPPP